MKKSKFAFENEDFVRSDDARVLRMISEYLEPMYRLQKYDVKNTIVFFGSARIPDKKEGKDTGLDGLVDYYKAAQGLAKEMTVWSMAEAKKTYSSHSGDQLLYVVTGGGPGIMEAANRGAQDAGGRSIGFNIALPFEQTPNEYQTESLNFQFKYFFMRKLWFLMYARAVCVFPGGFGTLDEFMEMLTLIQTEKYKDRPIVLFGREFWSKVINFEYMVESGVISREDLDLFLLTDTVQEARDYLVKNIRL